MFFELTIQPWFTFVSLFCVAHTAGVGIVYIGDYPDDLVSSVSTNQNQNSGTFLISIRLVDEQTGELLLSYESDVTVTCALSPVNEQGYSSATFSPLTIPQPGFINPRARTVSFSTGQPGRSAVLQCWGDSVALNDEDLPQFDRERSISEPVVFTVRQYGRVHVCEDVVQVPSGPTQSTFMLELSEPVVEHNVTVTCSSSAANPSGDIPGMDLTFPTVQLFIGETRTQVEYSIVQLGSPVVVFCQAQSQGQGASGQFVSFTSTGGSAMFVAETGSVMMYPSSNVLQTTTLQVFLVLSGAARSEVTFACQVQVVNTTSEAVYVANNPDCGTIVAQERPQVNVSESNATSANTAGTPVSTDSFATVTSASPAGTTVTTESYRTSTGHTETSVPSDSITTSASTFEFSLPTDSITTSDSTFESSLPTHSITTSASTIESSLPTAEPTTSSDVRPVAGAWSLSQDYIVFEEGDIYREIRLSRSTYPREPQQELVIVSCCAPTDNNMNNIYNNKSATLLSLAQLQPNVHINWTHALGPSDPREESPIENPAYVRYAPCPCDLTGNDCDINCCCDMDCTDSEVSTFECQTGVLGGEDPAIPEYMCEHRSVKNPDWFPLMCVWEDNTPLLGFFYYASPAITSLSTFTNALAEKEDVLNYRMTDKVSPDEPHTGTDYAQGISVKTGLPKPSTISDDLYIGPNYRLTLPQRAWTGDCLHTAPVRYLLDTDQTCVSAMTEELCRADSMLSASMYVRSTTQSNPPCHLGQVVLENYGDKVVATTYTDYICASDIGPFVRSMVRTEDVYSPTSSSLFASRIPFDNVTSCEFDNSTRAYVCDLVDLSETVSDSPQRCSWDDSYMAAPTPTLDSANQICRNAVLDVKYNFTWQGSEILVLNATVILGDVPLQSTRVDNVTLESTDLVDDNGVVTEVPRIQVTEITTTVPTVLSQSFQVTFSPLFVAVNLTGLNNTDENSTERINTERYQRSGNPGYEFGLPVFSGKAVMNGTEEFMYYDVNDTHRLAIWNPGPDGLCHSAGRQVVTFGENSLSGCALRLRQEDLDNCTYLRQLVLAHQDLVMPGGYVSIGGDPDRFHVMTDWLQVFRDDLSAIMPNYTEPVETMTMTAEPTTQEDLTSTSQDNATLPEVPSYTDQLTGRCLQVPAGIHLTIIYKQTGENYNLPLFSIVGAKISYTLATWSLDCAAGDGQLCSSVVDGVSTFMVTSSVRFIEAAPVEPKVKTRFEEENGDDSDTCHQETCWQELGYPLLQFTGDPHQYNLAFTLVSLVFVAALYLVTRPPWWS